MEPLKYLIAYLKSEYPNGCENFSHLEAFDEFRSLVNIRPPGPASGMFYQIQDALLQERLQQKGLTDLCALAPVAKNQYLWQGDITTLRCGAIVNAANAGLTGCYCPCHRCIDNEIHTYAGVQLRMECAELLKNQGAPEPVGKAKITKAYNLPCKAILHTVGPAIRGIPSPEECEQLAQCYQNCLALAVENRMESIAFCCISTGEFHFPNEKAAQIAIGAVQAFLAQNQKIKVVYNVFKNRDHEIYRRLLG